MAISLASMSAAVVLSALVAAAEQFLNLFLDTLDVDRRPLVARWVQLVQTTVALKFYPLRTWLARCWVAGQQARVVAAFRS